MISAFIAGELVRDPESRTSQSGKIFATAILRVDAGIVNLSVFDEDLRATLGRLRRGDPVAASGRLSARPYLDKHQQPQAGLSLLVTQIMTSPARRREAKPRPRPAPVSGDHGVPFDDALDDL